MSGLTVPTTSNLLFATTVHCKLRLRCTWKDDQSRITRRIDRFFSLIIQTAHIFLERFKHTRDHRLSCSYACVVWTGWGLQILIFILYIFIASLSFSLSAAECQGRYYYYYYWKEEERKYKETKGNRIYIFVALRKFFCNCAIWFRYLTWVGKLCDDSLLIERCV